MSKSSVSPTCSIWMSLAIGSRWDSSTKASMLFLVYFLVIIIVVPRCFCCFFSYDNIISLITVQSRLGPFIQCVLGGESLFDVPQVCCVLKLPKSFLFTFIYQLGFTCFNRRPYSVIYGFVNEITCLDSINLVPISDLKMSART